MEEISGFEYSGIKSYTNFVTYWRYNFKKYYLIQKEFIQFLEKLKKFLKVELVNYLYFFDKCFKIYFKIRTFNLYISAERPMLLIRK